MSEFGKTQTAARIAVIVRSPAKPNRKTIKCEQIRCHLAFMATLINNPLSRPTLRVFPEKSKEKLNG